MINIALYKPDIPQNTGAIIRLSACLNLKIHIIEPSGFNLNDSRFKRVAMDYINFSEITRYPDFETFLKKNMKSRIILMTTKSKKIIINFNLKKMIFYFLEERAQVYLLKFIKKSKIN
jgi:tRNA (cytidine/uridine-2'-O-)-methyltransferase